VAFAVIPGTGGREAAVITQHRGRFWRLSLDGSFPPTLFGDIASRINAGFEEGLLSLTFSPDYQTDGLVYVYYTSNDCSGGAGRCSYLSRFPVADNDIRDGYEQVILEVEQPQVNHNGGRILFGPDGFLYLSLGDGGGAGDTQGAGQDNTDLLGSVLRLDVSGAGGYRVPPDNPFVEGPGADEVFAYGLRNPWRFSFDRQTGDLWLGDVGQAVWEEVDLVVKGGNYGWNCFEGFADFDPGGCPQSGFQPPRAVYRHDGASCSITGGYVYRGADMPELNGWYVYGDYCSGIVWALNTATAADPILLVDTNLAISSFAELPDGELLLLAFDNTIYRLAGR
jgi:glucose/arabinose dehydrogenase